MGSQAEHSGERLVFSFFIIKESERERERGPLAQVTRRMMCAERCLVQLSTLHTQRALFLTHQLGPRSLPDPPPAADPQLLPACFPWPRSNCFMWLDRGRLEVGPRPSASEDTCFPVGRGCVGIGRVEQWGGGVRVGDGPPGREGNKRKRALSHALFGGGWEGAVHL